MCRFALVKSKKLVKPENILKGFAKMAKTSKAPDGDWQGDGWGISWLSRSGWQSYKSLLPIWEDEKRFGKFPKTEMFLVHARSASFLKDKGVIEFNQPFIYQDYAFVFNGMLKGVKLSIQGRIGAEKIWFILGRNLRRHSPVLAMQKTVDLLLSNTREVIALNIGLSDSHNLYSYSYFVKNPKYYQLQKLDTNDFRMICSEKFGDYNLRGVAQREVVEI